MGKPKLPKPPPPPAPVATPMVDEQPAEEEARRVRRKTGYNKTVLTGALTPASPKKTMLG